MYSTTLLALVAATLVGQAVASPHHHGFQHPHNKRALVTELVTVTDWVTVTVTDGETATHAKTYYTHTRKFRPRPSSQSTSSSSSSETPASPPPPPPAPTTAVPTTIVTQVTSTSTTSEQNTPPAAEAVPSSSSAAEVVNTPPPPPPVVTSTEVAAQPSPSPQVQEGNGSGQTGGGNGSGGSTGNGDASAKRGLAYNDPTVLTRFLSSGTKVSWAYNWGQYDDSGTNLEFCPMLWGLKLNFAQTWPGNAQKAIDGGSKCLLSFNEPDLGEQSNLSPQVAAQKHIELMNPFSGKALIGSPAITNSGAANQGIDWLKQWFAACDGKCAVDFVNIHIYGVDTNTFLTHLRNVNAAFSKPVWITEFAFGGSDDEINSQLETVIDQIEHNATYAFVDRYSYFMAADGHLAKGNTVSTYGKTFAYGA